jgi:predicted enzyme related to lactoylglutathione lyase
MTMATRDEPWPEGTPAWADLMTSDHEASWDFYRQVFGWEIEDTGPDSGHYGMAMLKGRPVAGIGQAMPGSEAPVAWTTYLSVRDLDASAAAASQHGGTVLMEPMDVMAEGRMAVAADPTGGVFGMWQAGNHYGAQVVNQPGALCWNELMTRDPARARQFYAEVFGYEYTKMDGDFDYTTIDGEGPGNTVGGLGELSDSVPAGTPPHWMNYFEVKDADASVSTIAEAGGTVMSGPFDSPFGRIAVIADPQGGVFSIIQPPAGAPSGT